MKFEHQISEGNLSHDRAWDRTLLFSLYNATFWAKNITIMSQKWAGKAPKVTDVYMEAILMPSFISIG